MKTNTTQPLRKPEEVTPIFGLRYLEDEDAEVNGVAGCLMYDEPPIDNGSTYYTTNCDYMDID